MRRILTAPATLDSQGFDALLREAAAPADGEPTGCLIDARHVRWADPYGMMGLLALGRHLQDSGSRPVLQLPESSEVVSYLGRMDFFRHAGEVMDVPGAPPARKEGPASHVLLEITPVQSHDDVHEVVEHVGERAHAILSERLGYSGTESGRFSMILSEVCQNIVEHAESGGWVGIQTYNWQRRLGRQVVMIAVMDLGVGFRGSLAKEHAARFGDSWSDVTALEAAFLLGTTRFRDPGRGQGLKQIRRIAERWSGKVGVRSGTARVADVPAWDDAPKLEEGLAPFPGTQIEIILPAKP